MEVVVRASWEAAHRCTLDSAAGTEARRRVAHTVPEAHMIGEGQVEGMKVAHIVRSLGQEPGEEERGARRRRAAGSRFDTEVDMAVRSGLAEGKG